MGKVIFSQVCVHSQGVPQSQVLSQGSGTRSFPGGTPVLTGRGTPVPDRGYPRTGVLPGQDRTQVPPGQDRTWVPPGQDSTGVPPQGQDWGTPPPPNSRASTCYTAGGMPLVVTQDDFLVLSCFEYQVITG